MQALKKFCEFMPVLSWLLLLGIVGGIENDTIALYPGALWIVIVLLASCLCAAVYRIYER